jgi:hypothetical protein
MEMIYRGILGLMLIAMVGGIEVFAEDWERVQSPPDEIPTYTIKRVNQGIEIDGVVDEADWERTATIYFNFPWRGEQRDGRQGTIARMLWDGKVLYISYVCDDPYLDSEVTEHDGPVYKEDAVEVFAAPGEDFSSYFGYEMNINGALLDYIAFGGGEEWTPHIYPPWQSEGVRIATTYDGTLNDHGDADRGWSLEVAIPLSNFRHLGGRVPPQPGDKWRLNLNRTAGFRGKFSLWSDTHQPKPSFHHAVYFGEVFFSSELVKKKCNCQQKVGETLE